MQGHKIVPAQKRENVFQLQFEIGLKCVLFCLFTIRGLYAIKTNMGLNIYTKDIYKKYSKFLNNNQGIYFQKLIVYGIPNN